MLACRLDSHTFLGTAILAAALVAGSVRADADDAAADAARAFVAARFADLTPQELRERARQTGHLVVQGTAHLEGRIFAESFRVAPGAAVTMEPGTLVYSVGDIRIDAPILAPPKPAKMPTLTGGPGKAGAGLVNGLNGPDAQDVIFTCTNGDFTVTQVVQVADGSDGQSIDIVGTSGLGGNGGRGGGIIIQCTGTVTISANLAPGRGGFGGDARVTGHDGGVGKGGESVNAACGGKGGKSGGVRITAPKVVFTLDPVLIGRAAGRIALRPGGSGGRGIAIGGKGGDSPDCYTNGGAGGSAIAIGGKPGASTTALVQCKILDQPEFDAHDISGFDDTEGCDGGDAFAYGGTGGAGGDILLCFDILPGCPATGRAGGTGGSGGKATATGGAGGAGGRIGGGTGILRKRKQAQAEAFPGFGGNATAVGGSGGIGWRGETAQAPGAGGSGGSGGSAFPTGGKGGSAKLGKKAGVAAGPGQGPVQGGRGGDANATSGDGANGDNGGDCCEKSGGNGAPGGKGGASGAATPKAGAGGFGFTPGPDGATSAIVGAPGAKGVKGANCPSIIDEFITMVGSLPSPLHVNVNAPLQLDFTNTGAGVSLHIEVCCDGRVIGRFDFFVPAGSLSVPGAATFLSNLFINTTHASHHISIMIRGKEVKAFNVPVI